jgi:hypothetical protein
MTKTELEARIAELEYLLELETKRADSADARANDWLEELERKNKLFPDLASETSRVV